MIVLLALLIFFLPVGTRKILGHSGLPAHEWNALFVSFTDILLILLLAASAFERFFLHRVNEGQRGLGIRECLKSIDALSAALFLFLAAVGISVARHGFDLLSVFRYIKLLMFAGFAVLVRSAFRDGKGDLLITIFLLVALLESALAIGQFFMQHDFGLRILGESPLDSRAAGIAKIDVGRIKIMRAYGTFSHPNVLAMYIVSAIFGVLVLALKNPAASKWFAAVFPLMLALVVSFSRSAFAALALGILAILWYSSRYRTIISKETRATIIAFFFAIGVSALGYAILFFPFWQSRAIPAVTEGAVVERVYYAGAALKMITSNPAFGVGWGRFSDRLPEYVEPKPIVVPSRSFPLWLLQPVHNIYLLIAAEAGIGALLAFIFFAAALLKRIVASDDAASIPFAAGFLAMLAAGFFDHLLLTNQQGALVFWFFVGILMAGKTHKI